MRSGCCFFLVSDFFTTTDAISSTLKASSSVSNECICGKEILSNSTLIKELGEGLSELRQQLSFLNRSIWTVNHSKTTLDVFDDLREKVMGISFNMMKLNASALELQHQISHLNLSILTLKHSETAIDHFDDLNVTVMGVVANILTLNNSVMDLKSDSGYMRSTIRKMNDSIMTVKFDNVALKGSDVNLSGTILLLNNSVMAIKSETLALKASVLEFNDSVTDVQSDNTIVHSTIMMLNNSIMTVRSDNAALKASVVKLNDSQVVSTSMFPGWPMAITCNMINDYDEYFGVYTHYLTIVEEDHQSRYDRWQSPMYTYRWVERSTNSKYSDLYFYSDGSFYAHSAGQNLRGTDCDDKSIQELRAVGLAFDFVIK